MIHGDPTAAGLAKGAFLLTALWWTRSIYTWATNWTGTDGSPTKLFLLAIAATTLRAFRHIAIERSTAAAVIIALGIVAGGLTALTLAALVALVLVIALVWEHVHSWTKAPPR